MSHTRYTQKNFIRLYECRELYAAAFSPRICFENLVNVMGSKRYDFTYVMTQLTSVHLDGLLSVYATDGYSIRNLYDI